MPMQYDLLCGNWRRHVLLPRSAGRTNGLFLQRCMVLALECCLLLLPLVRSVPLPRRPLPVQYMGARRVVCHAYLVLLPHVLVQGQPHPACSMMHGRKFCSVRELHVPACVGVVLLTHW